MIQTRWFTAVTAKKITSRRRLLIQILQFKKRMSISFGILSAASSTSKYEKTLHHIYDCGGGRHRREFNLCTPTSCTKRLFEGIRKSRNPRYYGGYYDYFDSVDRHDTYMVQ